MSDQDQRISLAKAVLWEEAKGKLRAIAAAEGARYGGMQDEETGLYKFQVISQEVEGFIKAFEDEGLHE